MTSLYFTTKSVEFESNVFVCSRISSFECYHHLLGHGESYTYVIVYTLILLMLCSLYKRYEFKLAQPETDKIVQFLDPEKERKLLFLGPEIVKMVQQDLWAQKLMKWCNFWTQKLT